MDAKTYERFVKEFEAAVASIPDDKTYKQSAVKLKEDLKKPLNLILAIEGVNGVGKSTLFNRLRQELDSSKIGFLSFPKFHQYAHNPVLAARYVNKQIANVWDKYDLIISDRWVISNEIYQKDTGYLDFLNEEYKKLLYLPDFILISPRNIFKAYWRMLHRNYITKKKSGIGLWQYWKLIRRYKKILAPRFNTYNLDDRDIEANVQFVKDYLISVFRDRVGLIREMKYYDIPAFLLKHDDKE